jgi:hypothetical protein
VTRKRAQANLYPRIGYDRKANLGGSPLVREITCAGRPVALHLTKRDLLPEVRRDLDIPRLLTGDEGEAVARIMTYDPSLAAFAVESVGIARNSGENVSVFSVSRI